MVDLLLPSFRTATCRSATSKTIGKPRLDLRRGRPDGTGDYVFGRVACSPGGLAWESGQRRVRGRRRILMQRSLPRGLAVEIYQDKLHDQLAP